MRVLIVGAGYTGHRLGVDLAASGHDVVGTARRVEAPDSPYPLRPFDLHRPDGIEGILSDRGWDDEPFRVVFAAGPPRAGSPEETRNLFSGFLDVLEGRRLQHFLYISSTSVYGDAGGDWVDESYPMDPVSRSGEGKVLCERLLEERLGGRVPLVRVRPGGIYGPGRSGKDRYLDPEYRLVGGGKKWTNRIHVVDLVRALARLVALERSEVFNVVDGHPVRLVDLVKFVYRETGHDPASIRSIPWKEAERRYSEMRLGLLRPQKRVSNRKLVRTLDFTFRYPDVYVGMRELLG